MPPKTTLWTLDDHTRGKHLVLKSYMDAWLPIMRRWNNRVLFIDAFAGPGEYADGEAGSPVIALKSLTEHSATRRMQGQMTFLFIEKDFERLSHLERVVEGLKDYVPTGCSIHCVNAAFDETLTSVLDKIDDQKKRLAPAFVMIDPFGFSDTPMSVIQRILANPRTEIYISFMSNDINRFMGKPNLGPTFDELFGCQYWRDALSINDSEKRTVFLLDLYEECLRKAGAEYVLHFELYRENRLVYTVFFATQDPKGCDEMKKAIWKAMPLGNFKFRGSRANQLILGGEMADLSAFREDLQREFGRQDWVTIESVQDFVMTDRTKFHTSQLKRTTLAPMEEEGQIEVDPSTRKSRKTFPNGTRLRFIGPSRSSYSVD